MFMYCIALHCDVVCCSVLARVVQCFAVLACGGGKIFLCSSQYLAVCCTILRRVAVWRSLLQCGAVCCDVLRVVTCCNLLQCVALLQFVLMQQSWSPFALGF